MAKRRTINMVKSQVIYKDYSKDAERTALISGENLAHMFGKIARWYTDISWVGHKHVVADITDFPVLGTAASKDVPASGDAGNNEVVMGNDSRLTDARTPTSHTHSVSEITDFPTLGTAAGYDVSSSGDASNNEVVLGNDSRLTDARTPLSHTHTEADITNLGTYAGASIKGGAATSANKLNIGNSDIGNSTTPVYFDSETGLPIALEYTIEKSVPADAVFTDTTYSTMGPSGSSHAGGLVPDTPSTAGTSKYLREDGTWEVPPNSEYVHPSHTPYSSGLYKITVDALGHVSAASAVTGADLPSHSHTVSDITNFPTLGTAAGYDVPATGDADDDEVVLGNDSRLSDARTPLSHTHTEADISDLGTYAGSSTKGGAATSANKLNIGSSDIGSETKPVYFNATTGKPVACAYSLNASVPANAVFTDINVKQSPSTANESREVLFAGNTGNTETVGTTGKSNKLYFNPSTGALTATSFSGSVDASNLTGSIDAARLPNSGVTANSYGPAAGGTLTYGGTFDVPYVTVDKYGRLTAASTKTFTMPAQYAHPTYTSKTSGLYKITVDNLGHVSATAAVTGTDLPSHSHTLNMATSTGSSSITLAANTKYQLTAGGSTYIFTTPADTVYTHPTYTEKTNGLYKITVDELGHVSATAAVTASDLPSHTHPYLPDTTKYAGSSSVGGAATSANKLNIGSSNIGNSTTPVYFNSTTGLPVALNYTIEKSVPADAKFTDTVYTHPAYTAKASGLYKITVDELGHVSAASAVTGTDLPSHSHNLSMASSTGTSQISLSANTKYKLTAGGSTYIFTTPNDTNTTYSVASGDNNGQIKITPSSGDAYNVSVKGLGSAAYTNSSAYATSGHTHTLKIEASSGTSSITLLNNTKYQITAGGSTYVFTTPTGTAVTYTIETGDNNGQIKVTPSSGSAYNVSVKGLGSAAYTNSSAYAAASHTHSQYLPLAGGTMTGAITLALDKYNVDEYGLDCNNSNIIGVNNIKFKDDPDEDASEGIHFYRTDSTWDSLWGRNGALYFTPNHPTGTTNYTIYHSGNLTYSTIGAAAANHTHSNYLGAVSANGYWGMASPSGATNDWIRTTSLGIIPYQSGEAGSGHCGLGTSSWYFSYAYIDSIYGTLHGRADYSDNSYVLVTDPSSKGTYGIVFVADPSITEDNTLRKSNSIRMNHFVGAANTEGIIELILGNSVAKSSAGNSSGHLTLYNANGKWAEIYPNASATSDYNLYLPASTGTLALVGDNNHTHNYAGSSSAGGAATSANKLNTNAGSNVSPVYFSGGVPVACKQVASGAYFSTVPYVRSDGVMDIGRYLDFHTSNTSTSLGYRLDQWTTNCIEFYSPGTNNRVNIFTAGNGYAQLSFQLNASNKAYTANGIVVRPLNTTGSIMQIECGGNMVIGSGESPSTLYDNSYDSLDTSETERLYLASDAEICFITSAQTYSDRKEVILDTNGNFRIGPSQVIVQTQNSTSNYTELVNWWSGGTNPGNYGPSIGQHNTGDTDGSIIILPYHTTSNPWDAGVGLYVSKTRLLYNGTAISLNGHTHSYLPLSGGTMTGHIVFNSVTSTSYPASSNYLYWSGSTDWAKIYYRVDAADAGRLVLDIGDDTNARIDFAYNGTTKSYIDTNGNFSGNAASATKLGSNAGGVITPVYFSGGKPVACNVYDSSGSYFNNVATIRSDGVMEMGRYIDFHNASDSTYDYTYRLESPSNGSFTLTSNTNNVLKLYSATGYNQIRFHTGKSDKPYDVPGITVYPLTTSGSCMVIESDGNMIIGAGESPSSIYSNDYLGAQTSENEYMFVSADTGVVLISGADTFANKSAAIFDYDGAFRPVTADTLSIGSSTSYWNKAYITQTIGGTGGTWISARDRATVKSICVPASSAFCPVATVKTNNGAWSIGSLGTSDKSTEGLYFSYTTDANYSTETNAHASYTISTTGAFSGSAAKWTTARTLTIGSTGKSVDGSGNVSWSLSEIGAAAASHDHNLITRNDTITYGASQLQWFDLSGTGTVSASTAYNPSNDWYHHIMLNHGNNNGYYVDLAICFHSDDFYYKRIVYGSIANASRNNGWVRVLDQYNYGSYVTPDGIGAAPSNHTHSYLPLSGGTMTGNITFTDVTSTSYPASSNYLYWLGSTDWAKIYYRVDASDAGRLVLDIGDDANTRIDFAYNGTTKSYIDTNGNFSGTSNITNYINIVAGNEIRFNVGSKPSSAIDLYIGYAWSDGTKDAKIQRYKFENGSGTLTIVEASDFEASSSVRVGTSSNQGTITLYNNNNKSFSIVASPNATAGGGITLPPTSGLMTNIVYKATDSYLGAIKANSYWGMATPAGATNDWIRTTSLGIIPYQSGEAGSGHSSLGTSTWYFGSAYIDHVYGTVDTSENVYCYDFGDSSYTSPGSYGVVFAADPTTTEINSLRKRIDFRINYRLGAANSEGVLELVIGNSVGSSAAGNCSGHLTLYNSNGKWCEIYPSPYATSDYNLYLPGDNGTLALIGKSPYFGCMFAGIMEGTISSHASLAQNNQSWCGTYQVNGTWYNMISVRHRNGAADGNSYGFYIRNTLTGASNLVYNQQYSGNWRGELTILDSSCYSSYALPLSGGTMTGNLALTESNSILLRPNHSSYTSGIGYDTSGNECIGIWAKNTVTRLRWHAGTDMTTMTAGTMMDITYPDFEISKASGSAHGYIGGYNITRSYALFSGSASITAGKEKTTLTLSDQLSNYDWCVIRFWYSGSPAGYCEAVFASAHYSAWLSAAFSTTPGGGTSYTACHTMSIYIDSPNAGTRNIYFNCDAGLTIYKVIGYMAD